MILTVGMAFIFISLFYSIGLNILFFTKQHVENYETKLFGIFLPTNLCGLLLELSCTLSMTFTGADSILSIMLSKIFLVYLIFFVLLLLLYIYVICGSDKTVVELTDRQQKIRRLFILLFIFAAISDLILPVKLNSVGGAMYSSGPAVTFVYYISAIASFYCLIKFAVNIKNIRKKKNIPMLVYIVCQGIMAAIQQRFPEFTIATSMETFMIFLMYNTIENPDVKMVEQMELAKEQAEKANRAKTDFLSSMSHEIRTPLNAIVGFSDCIMDADNLGEAKENAKDIVNASQTLLEIVNGILDISKIEAGKIEIINSPYNAPEIFNELATLITPKMHEKGLDFTFNIAPDLPKTLYGDHANIRKVVTNLLSNAAKYTEHGFVHYEVNCINSKDYTKLIISVEDSGRGIKKESIDKLFTKFQRLDEDRNTTIEGTGLGLAITKQLTELMGGKIIVHTVYGEGSKFTVVINQRIEKIELKDTKKAKTTLDLHDVRVLMVDDTPLNLKVTCKLFERYNANHVVTCDSGFECLERIQRGEVYDIILLDDMMPKMSGVETLKKLREIPGFNIPTVALTANAITGMREKYLADGFNDYLAKPIEKDEMIRVINECLGRSQTEELSAVTNFINNEDLPDQATKVDDWSNKQVRDAVLEVSDSTDSAQDDRNKIIPVEDNIEEILGDQLDLTEDTREFTVSMNPVKVDHIEDIEQLEDEEPTTPELVPVVDIEVSTDTPEKYTSPTEEKVEEVAPVENVNTTTDTFDRTYLEKNGADIDHALELLGDMDMYNATINDFVKEVDEKWDRINSEKESNDMENYAIDVHSLKSDCKYLGFMGLADIAYQHELKSKEKDSSYVNEHFNELEAEYKRVLEVVKTYVEHNPYEE